MYHQGNRQLQEQFESTKLADRLLEVTHHTELSEYDCHFITDSEFFFLATADDQARPDCSFKGGPKGFVQVVSNTQLAFPDYDGNGMFKSLGNIQVNPNVGLLFITMGASPQRIRVNGRATITRDAQQLESFVGAQLLVNVEIDHIFPNCPRYIPDLASDTPSQYVPQAKLAPIEPKWKTMDLFSDVVPQRAATPYSQNDDGEPTR